MGCVCWAVAIASSTVTTWFPDQVYETYQPVLYVYFPALRSITEPNAGVALLVVNIIVPYCLMTIFTVATGVEIHIHTKKAEHLNKTVFKRQIMLFKLLALMELALTVTLMPFVTVVFLDYGGVLTCDDISYPYLITFYVLCSNSIMNVLLYSFRDRMFVRDLKIVSRVIT